MESEHIVPFSEEGKDSADNIAAVYPNCHARIHRLGGEDKEVLKRNMEVNEEKLCKQLKGEE